MRSKTNSPPSSEPARSALALSILLIGGCSGANAVESSVAELATAAGDACNRQAAEQACLDTFGTCVTAAGGSASEGAAACKTDLLTCLAPPGRHHDHGDGGCMGHGPGDGGMPPGEMGPPPGEMGPPPADGEHHGGGRE